MAPPAANDRTAAWYRATIPDFLEDTTNEIIGTLTRASSFPVDEPQRIAWEQQIAILRRALSGLFGEATEFQTQGLELDWVIATWDADLRMGRDGWQHRKFHGSRWKQVHNESQKRYLVNAYRVLMTRGRQGMAIFVPPGDANDPTRQPAFYDPTYHYLLSLGLPTL